MNLPPEPQEPSRLLRRIARLLAALSGKGALDEGTLAEDNATLGDDPSDAPLRGYSVRGRVGRVRARLNRRPLLLVEADATGRLLVVKRSPRAAHEYAALRHVQGRNVIEAVSLVGDHLFLAYASGWNGLRTLSDALRLSLLRRGVRRLALPEARILALLAEVARALHRLHTVHGRVHADFGPDQVVFDGDRPLIIDLEYATVPGTRGTGAGKPLFACAAQLRGEAASARWDVYALATVAFLALGGRHPLARMDAERARRHRIERGDPRLSPLGRRDLSTVEAVLREALDPDATTSPTALDLARAFEHAASGRRPARRRRAGFGSVFAATVLLLLSAMACAGAGALFVTVLSRWL